MPYLNPVEAFDYDCSKIWCNGDQFDNIMCPITLINKEPLKMEPSFMNWWAEYENDRYFQQRCPCIGIIRKLKYCFKIDQRLLFKL